MTTHPTAPAAPEDVAPPAGASYVADWLDETLNGTTWCRFWRGTKRGLTGVRVDITGLQDGDGSVERHISVSGDGVQLSAATARMLAADLLDAADELDELNR